MKTCFKCGQYLPLDRFYKHKGMADGHLNKCIECARKDAINHRDLNIDRIRDYDRKRGNRQTIDYTREYRKRNTNKYRATLMVNNAIRDKKLFREPCQICGAEKAHAHHDDYLKPLNVRWLCAIHHKKWHLDNGDGLNG